MLITLWRFLKKRKRFFEKSTSYKTKNVHTIYDVEHRGLYKSSYIFYIIHCVHTKNNHESIIYILYITSYIYFKSLVNITV